MGEARVECVTPNDSSFVTDRDIPFPSIKSACTLSNLLHFKPRPEKERLSTCMDFRKGVRVARKMRAPLSNAEWIRSMMKTEWRLDFLQNIEDFSGMHDDALLTEFTRKFEARVFSLPGMSFSLACRLIAGYPMRVRSDGSNKDVYFNAVNEFVSWLRLQKLIRIQWPWMKNIDGLLSFVSPKTLEEAASKCKGIIENKYVLPRALESAAQEQPPRAIANDIEVTDDSDAVANFVKQGNVTAAQQKQERKKHCKEEFSATRRAIVARLNKKQIDLGLRTTTEFDLWGAGPTETLG